MENNQDQETIDSQVSTEEEVDQSVTRTSSPVLPSINNLLRIVAFVIVTIIVISFIFILNTNSGSNNDDNSESKTIENVDDLLSQQHVDTSQAKIISDDLSVQEIVANRFYDCSLLQEFPGHHYSCYLEAYDETLSLLHDTSQCTEFADLLFASGFSTDYIDPEMSSEEVVVSFEKSCKEQVSEYLAISEGNVDRCEDVASNERRSCIESVAIKLGDESVCQLIDDVRSGACEISARITHAVHTKDLSLCDTISSDTRAKSKCYGAVGGATLDASLCELSTTISTPADTWAQPQCYTDVAVGTGDAQYCGKINFYNWDETCYDKVVIVQKDISICSKVTAYDQDDKKSCYRNVYDILPDCEKMQNHYMESQETVDQDLECISKAEEACQSMPVSSDEKSLCVSAFGDAKQDLNNIKLEMEKFADLDPEQIETAESSSVD